MQVWSKGCPWVLREEMHRNFFLKHVLVLIKAHQAFAAQLPVHCIYKVNHNKAGPMKCSTMGFVFEEFLKSVL